MVIKVIAYVVFALLGLFLQAAVIHGSFPTAVAPDILIILVVNLGLRHNTICGVLAAFALGLLFDLASGLYLGPNAFAALVGFFVAGLMANKMYAERIFALLLITFVSSVAKSLSLVALFSLYLGADLSNYFYLQRILVEAGMSAILAPFILFIFFASGRAWQRKRQHSPAALRWSIAR